MAGGVGSRFWPLSRMNKPKQFLDILGVGQTLLQQTYNRFKKIIPSENIYIVTNADYGDLVIEQLPEINKTQVLLEPMRRNTAPCIAYANYKINKVNPNAKIVVAPSDHLILKEPEFINVVQKAFNFVDENDSLLTLGIQPSRPETGYGYIQINGSNEKIEVNKSLRKVKTFTEKPDLTMAKLFLESGDFYWNAGIFFWSLKSIMKAFRDDLPEVDNLFKEGIKAYNTDFEQDFISRTYPNCRNISIDYGIMEKAQNVYVLCSDFGWSDLGTWGSLYDHLSQDKNDNAIAGQNVFSYNTKNCIININNAKKLAVIQGLDDFIVVDTNNILLICKKEDEQKIKDFVNDIKLEKGNAYI
ncbi:MAG: mannose-1-phosphate guanylyltransferase [Bacteroidales bacterium]|nr:mannose-1-phosphate guanylyltransferase [Bacteroidales bacterium]